MAIGASSACFYPLETEKALLKVAELGFKKCEIFFNSPSEIEMPFLEELCYIRDSYGLEIVSVHPFTSFAEGYFIFSEYARRFEDSKPLYKAYFEAAATLGAKYVVLHGTKSPEKISRECYAQRYACLAEMARESGCYLAHENVVHHLGESVEFMKYLRGCVGEEFKMVLDIKQARCTGVDYHEFICEIGNSIAHVHISDYTDESNCAPVTQEGLFDFEELFTCLHRVGYEGDYILELYRKGFGEPEELSRSAEILRPILEKATKGV